MPRHDLKHKLQNINPDRLFNWLAWMVAIATSALVGAFLFYVSFFAQQGISPKQEHWGQFGDFLGGTVNPLMSFFALIAIVLTIILQSKQLETSKTELELSRHELEMTREEFSQSRKAAQEQVAHLKAEAKKTDIDSTLPLIYTYE